MLRSGPRQPLGGVGARVANRSARRRCSFRRKREEDIGAYDNAYYVGAAPAVPPLFGGAEGGLDGHNATLSDDPSA